MDVFIKADQPRLIPSRAIKKNKEFSKLDKNELILISIKPLDYPFHTHWISPPWSCLISFTPFNLGSCIKEVQGLTSK